MNDASSDATYSVTAAELRQFIEQYEHLESEKKDITEQQKEIMAEAKGRG
ncbi:MAG: GapR family DNA-binding domain-containing protein, partial [Albidovulum sp.]